MTLFDVSDADDSKPCHVRVLDTPVGKGIFATRDYPAKAIIGQITGTVMEDPGHGSEYSFEYENGLQLEPFAPFRYVNHSCDPNCEFNMLEKSTSQIGPQQRHLYLIALRDIQSEEQLTIEYNWPAASAIPCECGSPNCIGWVVCEEELDLVTQCFDYPDW